jgi:2-polyprenyl-3-methyl-5-hydroxy-6-metoxy-1,4-benzoquinol methylase
VARENEIPARLIPWDLDFSNPAHREEYDCHAEKYNFAALFTEGKTVLDIACGAGYGCGILRNFGGAKSVTGVDIDETTIKSAREHYGTDGIKFICSDYRDLEFKRQFDAIVSINTLEYIDDPYHFISILKNLLADGGELFISNHVTPTTDFNPHTMHDISKHKFFKMLRREDFDILGEFWQIKRFDPSGAVDLMKNKNAPGVDKARQKSITGYYLRHPVKALRRMRSLMVDGLTVKTLTVRAQLKVN